MTKFTQGVYSSLSIFLILSITCHGQALTDTAFLSRAFKNARQAYTNAIGNQSNLYNGVEYKGHVDHYNDVGNPYFISDEWVEGSIFYDDDLYENVPMIFDMITDKVVLDQPFSSFKLELINEKIKYFSLSGHTFIRLEGSDSTLRTGFYDLLYDGHTKVLARRRKEILEKIDQKEITVQYLESEKLFVYKNGKYFPVKSKSSVLKVLADRKKELRKFINKNNIDFFAHRDQAIARVAMFYDSPEAQP